METLAFVQGILTVVGFMMAFGVFWAIRKINDMRNHIDLLDRQLDETETRLSFRSDRDMEEVQKLIEQMYRDFDEQNKDVYSVMDSRFNRFETKIRNDKQLLNG